MVDFDNLINQEGLTALHKAIIGKKEAVISHLLRKGASPHVKDKVMIPLNKFPQAVECRLLFKVSWCLCINCCSRMVLLHFIMQFKLVLSKL